MRVVPMMSAVLCCAALHCVDGCCSRVLARLGGIERKRAIVPGDALRRAQRYAIQTLGHDPRRPSTRRAVGGRCALAVHAARRRHHRWASGRLLTRPMCQHALRPPSRSIGARRSLFDSAVERTSDLPRSARRDSDNFGAHQRWRSALAPDECGVAASGRDAGRFRAAHLSDCCH